MKNTIINIFTVIVAGAAVLIAVTFLFGGRFYAVLSGSMEPAVYTGDAVFVDSRSPFGEIEPGEIVCFESAAGTPVIHRAVRVTPEGIETKGDANKITDGISTTEKNYIGKVIFNIPFAGYIMHFLSLPRVRIIIITAACVILILSIYRSYVSKKAGKEQVL